jgi:2-polyprenyl-3-methyl-5-hydroxy-6-metoxy-1,4-benzoquinol methylase
MAELAEVHVNCAVCGSSNYRPLDDRVLGDRRIRNVICRQCGHVYINPRADEKIYRDFYQAGFSHEYRGLDIASGVAALADNARKKAKIPLRFITPFLKPGWRVLEIGSGFGALSAALRDDFGASEVIAVEPDPQAAAVAQQAFGLATVNKTIEDFMAQYTGEKFDLVLAHHVLEHFLDPAAFGTALNRLVKPDGLIYIGVPNVCAMAFPRGLFFRFPHVQSFTPFSLCLFLWRYGFKIIAAGPLDRPLEVMAARQESGRLMLPWTWAVKNSLPYGKVISRVRWYHVKQTGRLFIRDRIRPLIPRGFKEFAKRIFFRK